MADYSQAKIYRLVPTVPHEDGHVYYGSTIVSLSNRFREHKSDFNRGHNNCTSKLLFEIYGVDNVVIELVEVYACNNQAELGRREGYYIKTNACVNKYVAGRTAKERYEDNKEKVLEQQKDYYERHKDKIAERITCECGLECIRDKIVRHRRTKRHLERMANLPAPASI